MYCRKCGKQIDYDSEFCIECKAEAAARSVYREIIERQKIETAAKNCPPTTAPSQGSDDGGRLFGFPRALTAAIFATVYSFLVACLHGEGAGAFFVTFSGFAFPAILMGAASVRAFFKRRDGGYPLPTATLVLGAAALGTCALFSLIDFFL